MSDETPKREVKPRSEMTFSEHGVRQMHYDAIAAAGVQPEDVLKREYWAHVSARNMRSMTKISIMAEDYSWYGELIVFQTFVNGAHVAFISPPVRLGRGMLKDEKREFEVFDGGLSKKWSVRRLSDGRVMIDGCESEQEANAKLLDWIKAQGVKRAA